MRHVSSSEKKHVITMKTYIKWHLYSLEHNISLIQEKALKCQKFLQQSYSELPKSMNKNWSDILLKTFGWWHFKSIYLHWNSFCSQVGYGWSEKVSYSQNTFWSWISEIWNDCLMFFLIKYDLQPNNWSWW